MADNVAYKDGNDALISVASDDVGGVQIQRVKLDIGGDGVSSPVTAANPLRTLGANDPALWASVPDNTTPAPPVRLVGETIDQCTFADVGPGLLTTDMTLRKLGTGVGVSQASGNLVVTTGTTTSQEFLARSVKNWQAQWNLKTKQTHSQRIVNQSFLVLMADMIGEGLAFTINSATSITVTKAGHGFTAYNVGQGMMIGAITGAAGIPGRFVIASVPSVDTINFTVASWPASGSGTLDLFGWNYIKVLYNTATATNAFYDTQRKGWTAADTTLTIATSVTGHVLQIQNDIRANFVSDFVTASSTAFSATSRGSRVENIPDDNTNLYLYLWAYNATSAPASATTWTVGYWAVARFPKIPVHIAGGMQNGAQNPIPIVPIATIPVSFTQPALVAGTAAIGDVGLQARANATGAASKTHLVSTASTNATIVRNAAARFLGYRITNTISAVRYVKLHNQATTPTAGTGVVETIAVPGSSHVFGGLTTFGTAFTTGIGMTTVTGSADNDTAAVGAGDLIIDLFWM